MRKLAPLCATRPVLSKVGALPNMLLITVQPLFAVTQDCKVSANPFAFTDVDMREETPASCATALVEKMNTERRAFRCGIMRELASFGSLGTRVLKKVPADGNLGWVMLVHAGESAIAGA